MFHSHTNEEQVWRIKLFPPDLVLFPLFHTSFSVKIIHSPVGQPLRLEWKSQAVLLAMHAALRTSGFNTPVLFKAQKYETDDFLHLYEGGGEGTWINMPDYANGVKVVSCFRLVLIDLQYFEYRKPQLLTLRAACYSNGNQVFIFRGILVL